MDEDAASAAVAGQQYFPLRAYLDSFLSAMAAQQSSPSQSQQRASAKDKMTRLNRQQFTDLSTDVFDEMNRRQQPTNEVPFLPVRDDLHPKRNQARQKLATLPTPKFKDLACDVFFEIERRFPSITKMDSTAVMQGDRNIHVMTSGMIHEPQTSMRSIRSPMSDTGKSSVSEFSNVSNLEHLMADLGNMMGGGGNTGNNHHHIHHHTHTPNSGISPEMVDKLRMEYENRIESLQNRILHLESEAHRRQIDHAKELEDKVSTHMKIQRELELKYDHLQSDYKKLKVDYDGLLDDYNNQQQIANDIRAEASNLLSEIKSLSKKNEELLAERVKAGITSPLPYSQLNARSDEPENVIDKSRVTAYQSAIEGLLKASRAETPTNVLVAMKGIVISCKNITEDTESYENTSTSLLDSERENLEAIKARLSSALTSLMAAAKAHATGTSTGGPAASIAALESAASALTAIIIELVRFLNFRQSNSSKEQRKSGTGGGDVVIYKVDELKQYLEKQTDLIVHAIQSLLVAMRQESSSGSDMNFNNTIQNITTIVDSVVSHARNTMTLSSATDFKNRGDPVLRDLSSANANLYELGKSMSAQSPSSSQSKLVKQKLASSSYEIAKFVKELISLLGRILIFL